METKIGKKLRDFIQAFDGDEIKCMRLAGYTGADSYLRQKAKRFLSDPVVIKAIEERDKYVESRVKLIADRQERQSFWTGLMRNEDPDARVEYDSNGIPKPIDNVPLSQRIKASELLGKSEADFVDRVHVEGQITITDIIKDSYLLTDDNEEDSIETIEAQYRLLKNYEDEEDQEEKNKEDEEGQDENRSAEDIQETLVQEIQESNEINAGLDGFV